METTAKDLPRKHNPQLHDLIWDLLKDKEPGVLLDIPSGPGYFARNAIRNGFQAVAAEIDESLHFFDYLEYKKIDMSKAMPFDDESFDYVVSIEGIEHIENQFLFLRECFRILKPGGSLFLTTPNTSSLSNRLRFLVTGAHDNPPAPIRSDTPNIYFEHINRIPFHRLETFLRFSGFEIEKLTTHRLKRGSLFLYPVIYPFAKFRYSKMLQRHFAGKPDEEMYRGIVDMYLSKAVLCGGHIVVVAGKVSE